MCFQYTITASQLEVRLAEELGFLLRVVFAINWLSLTRVRTGQKLHDVLLMNLHGILDVIAPPDVFDGVIAEGLRIEGAFYISILVDGFDTVVAVDMTTL